MKLGVRGLALAGLLLWLGTALAWHIGINGMGNTPGLIEKVNEPPPRKSSPSSWYFPLFLTFVVPPLAATLVSVAAILKFRKREKGKPPTDHADRE